MKTRPTLPPSRWILGSICVALVSIAVACAGGGVPAAPAKAPAAASQFTRRTFAAGPPLVSLAFAAAVDDQGKLVMPQYTFAPDQAQIIAVVQVGNLSSATLQVKVNWSHLDDDGNESRLFEQTISVSSNDRVFSKAKNPGTLAQGAYRVTATLDGKMLQSEADVYSKGPSGTSPIGTLAGSLPTDGGSGHVPRNGGSAAHSGPGSSSGCTAVLTPEILESSGYVDYSANTVEVLADARCGSTEIGMGVDVTVNGSTTHGGRSDLGLIYFDPCKDVAAGLGQDLPGAVVHFEGYGTHDLASSEHIPAQPVDVTLGPDTKAPDLAVTSKPEKGSVVHAGDRIEVNVTATEIKGGGPWQYGVQHIQVTANPGGLVGQPWENPSKKPLPCENKTWEQKYKAIYTVPNNPPDKITLCAIADDYAGNERSKCADFVTGEKWAGTMHSEGIIPVPGNPCQEVWDTTFELQVSGDGKVSGTGHGTATAPAHCAIQPKLPPVTAAVLRIEGQKSKDKFELRIFPVSVSPNPGIEAGYFANWIQNGGIDPPSQTIPIISPKSAQGNVTINGTSDSQQRAGIVQNYYDLKCVTCP